VFPGHSDQSHLSFVGPPFFSCGLMLYSGVCFYVCSKVCRVKGARDALSAVPVSRLSSRRFTTALFCASTYNFSHFVALCFLSDRVFNRLFVLAKLYPFWPAIHAPAVFSSKAEFPDFPFWVRSSPFFMADLFRSQAPFSLAPYCEITFHSSAFLWVSWAVSEVSLFDLHPWLRRFCEVPFFPTAPSLPTIVIQLFFIVSLA